MASATGFTEEYINENIGTRLVVVASVFIGLEICVVALRFFARYKYRTQWGLDDYLMAPALLFCLGTCVIGIIEAKIAGVGRHLDVLYATDIQAVINWAKCGYAMEEVYCVAIAFPKLSILASYMRIFRERPYRIACYIAGGIIIAAAAAGIITSLAACHPFSARWDPLLYTINCISFPRYWQGMSAPNIATDLIVLSLPMPLVWRLKIPKKQKIALACVFLLGSFGIAASIIRLVATLDLVSLTADGTWITSNIAIWSLVEPGCYLIASCLPIFRSFLPGTIEKKAKKSRGYYGRYAPKSSENTGADCDSTPLESWRSQNRTNNSPRGDDYIELV